MTIKPIGPIPAARYYAPDSVSDEGRKEFIEWYYVQMEQDQFTYKKNCYRIVRDVDILEPCCVEFRTLFMQVTSTGRFYHGRPTCWHRDTLSPCTQFQCTKYRPEVRKKKAFVRSLTRPA